MKVDSVVNRGTSQLGVRILSQNDSIGYRIRRELACAGFVSVELAASIDSWINQGHLPDIFLVASSEELNDKLFSIIRSLRQQCCSSSILAVSTIFSYDILNCAAMAGADDYIVMHRDGVLSDAIIRNSICLADSHSRLS
jgi:DNA-binding NarL/FixJ family response regulator